MHAASVDPALPDAPPPSAARAIGWRLGYLAVQGVSSVGLFLAFAGVLPAGAFRAIAVAQGVLVVAQAIGDFGLSQAGVTALPVAAAAEPRRAAALYAGAARVFVAGAVAGALLAAAAAWLLPQAARDATLLIAPAAGLTVISAGADCLLRSRGELRRPVVLVAASRLFAFGAIPIAVASDSAAATALAVTGFTAIGTLPSCAVVLRFARGSADADMRWFARAALPLGLSQILVVGSARLNTLVLASTGRLRDAAAFESGWRLYQLAQYAGGGVATAIGPLYARALGSGARGEARRLAITTLIAMGGLGLVLGLAGWLLAPSLARAFFRDVSLVEGVLRALALTLPLSLSAAVAQVVLASLGRPRRWIPMAYAAGTAINVLGLVLFARDEGVATVANWCAAGILLTSAALLTAAAWCLASVERQRPTSPSPDAP